MELLIGTKKLQLSEPWRAINSEDNGPSAVKTTLGWIMKSPLRNPTETISEDNTRSCATVNRISIENVELVLVVHCKSDFPEDCCDDKLAISVPGGLHGHCLISLPEKKAYIHNYRIGAVKPQEVAP